MNPELTLTGVFAAIVIIFLIIDLGFLNRKSHIITMKAAWVQTGFWVVTSLIFAGLIYYVLGLTLAAEFLSAYVTEKMLSVDNLFVMLAIFSYFKIDPKYQHRVLFWGIMGVVLLRGIFIGAGATIVTNFNWLLYLFGIFLIYAGYKTFKDTDDQETNFSKNKIFKFLKTKIGFYPHDCLGKFFIHWKGKTTMTLLFVVLILIETTDVLFAVDSIPAVFSITQDPFIAFTSNIFAVMGLRSLFFVVENLLHKFYLLKKGVSFVLIFIGVKMLISWFEIHISATISLVVILISLITSLILSIIIPRIPRNS